MNEEATTSSESLILKTTWKRFVRFLLKFISLIACKLGKKENVKDNKRLAGMLEREKNSV